jgi:hypothetical protein
VCSFNCQDKLVYLRSLQVGGVPNVINAFWARWIGLHAVADKPNVKLFLTCGVSGELRAFRSGNQNKRVGRLDECDDHVILNHSWNVWEDLCRDLLSEHQGLIAVAGVHDAVQRVAQWIQANIGRGDGQGVTGLCVHRSSLGGRALFRDGIELYLVKVPYRLDGCAGYVINEVVMSLELDIDLLGCPAPTECVPDSFWVTHTVSSTVS